MMLVRNVLCVLWLHVAVRFQVIKGFLFPEAYNLTLTNSGPAIVGSELTFQAELVLRTGGEPHDEKHFLYLWSNNVDCEIRKIPANFNSTLHQCYTDVDPRKATITVRVFDRILFPFGKIASQSQEFELTGTLNGNLSANQPNHTKPVISSVFSTSRPVTLTLNLTDNFRESPIMTYIWLIDGNEEASNLPRCEENFDLGEHNVTVKVKTVSIVVDCDEVGHENSLSGTFTLNFTMKDPVTSTEIHSRSRYIPLSHTETFSICFNGSGPFIICWSLLGEGRTDLNATYMVNCSSEVDVAGNYDIVIRMPKDEGEYVLDVTVENDVSVVALHKNLKVEQLNGNLSANQTFNHTKPVIPSVFSTSKPVNLTLNLTDDFRESPNMTYIWLIDGNTEASNCTTRMENFDLGEHNVTVKVKTVSFDCDGGVHENSLSGTFTLNFTMKDPVTSTKIHGRSRYIPPSHTETFSICFNGSGPFIICWSLLGEGRTDLNATYMVNCSSEVDVAGNYDIVIRMPKDEGEYVLDVTVENDVSVVALHKNLKVAHRSPKSSSNVALLVTCGLLALCVVIAVGVYIAKRPKKKQRSEVADFDFHPSTLSVGSSRSRNKSFIAIIKPTLSYVSLTFQRLFHRDNYARDHRRARYMRPIAHPTYGSITDSVELAL